MLIAFGYGDHEPQIGAYHTMFRAREVFFQLGDFRFRIGIFRFSLPLFQLGDSARKFLNFLADLLLVLGA